MDILQTEGINERGYGTIAKSVMTDRQLSATAKAIYAYFCSYAGAGNQCFPSRNKICYDLNITPNTYTKHLKTLIKNGYISVKQQRENGRWARNIYTLHSIVPCRKKPYIKKSDTEKTVSQNLRLNNNNNKINNDIISSSRKKDDGGDIQNAPIVYTPLDEEDESTKLYAYGTNGNVMLSEVQIMELSLLLGGEETDYYIDKLDDFITKNGARVKNHYQTIKRWAYEDRGV